jgi:hypothetical protein
MVMVVVMDLVTVIVMVMVVVMVILMQYFKECPRNDERGEGGK